MNEAYPFLSDILERFAARASSERFLVGIVGVPASGKSYLAERLPTLVNERLGKEVATRFAMDGFHFYDAALHMMGMHPHKGAHFTFDVKRFIEKLVEIKESPDMVSCPIFDRSIEDPVEDVNQILPTHRIVFVEGNYLLSRVYPWITIKHILDSSVFVHVDPEIQLQRLVERHQQGGKSKQEAENKAYRTDLPNSAFILEDQGRAGFQFWAEGNRSSNA